MTDIHVIEARDKKERNAFVRFPMKLYSGCKFYVPPLIADELKTFSRDKNPAFEYADAKLFMALKGTQPVGRITAILNRAANERTAEKDLRFGWFDCVNDHRVATALFDAVEDWGRELGMETLTGPLGFNNFDKIGMLTEGFDKVATIATYYNYPYYPDLVTRYGFAKEADYVEYLISDIRKDGFPPRLSALAEKLTRRAEYRVLEFSSRKQLFSRGRELFDLMQEIYADLYGYIPLTERERDFYIRRFFPLLHKQLLKVMTNEQGQMIGFVLAMPSLSEAYRKANGRLFPFGFLHLRKAFGAGNKALDLYLGGVKAGYRGRGVDLLMAAEMYKSAASLGFEKAESNPELETNSRIRAEWKHFEHVQHKRRRLYKKTIGKD